MSSLNEYAEKLKSHDETERTYAAEDLGYLNAPEAVAPLLTHLPVETSAAVRIAIFQALIRIDSDQTITRAIQLLRNDDPQIRNLAVGLLQRKGDRALPFLKSAMREGDHDTRKFVLDALSGIQSSGAAEIYAAALADQDANVVITAVENLGNLRAAQFAGAIEDLLKENTHPMLSAACLEALAAMGNPSSLLAIRRFLPHLSALPQFFFSPCLKAMATLGGETEFQEILALFAQAAPQKYPAILSSLVTLYERCIYQRIALPDPDTRVLTLLRSLVNSNEPASCRYLAVRVLGFWVQRDDVSASLVSCLTNLERFVRIGAAEALRASNRSEFDSLLASHEAQEFQEEVNQALIR